MNFDFATAQRIVFGAGRASELPGLAASLGSRPLLVTGAAARAGTDMLQPAATFQVRGEPTFDAVRAGAAAAREARCDVVVAVGGGSVLDAGKAIAMLLANGGDPLDYAEIIGAHRPILQPSVPFIAVPTTAGTGSEATRNAVLASPEHRVKVSLRSPHMLPRVALVDPDLALDLPPALTAATGLDALSQLIEPYVSCRATPITDALCRDGIACVARALPRACADGQDREARGEMALAALYSGIALANAGLGAVHGFAGPIGGAFTAPHGAVCAALLPGVFAANFQRLEKESAKSSNVWKFSEVARLLTGRADATPADGARWLDALRTQLGIPGLAAYGVGAEHADDLVAQARKASSMKGNPVELPDHILREILLRAL
jgi:alcohol dehydrogenase class IV